MPPEIADTLPELDHFLRDLAANVQAGQITSWQSFTETCFAFYTLQQMDKIDAIIPYWKAMASHKKAQTLVHVTSVFVALLNSDEYRQLNPRQRVLAEWGVLFHDVTKVPPVPRGHDYIHGYRSAAVAGKALTQLDFPLKEGITPSDIDEWYDLTWNAILYSEEHDEQIQDVSKFPEIVDGLQHIHHEDAFAIVMSVLLHIGIDYDPGYPCLAPIPDAYLRQYVTADAIPVIRNMMLADGSGWELFSEDRTQDETRRPILNRIMDNLALR